MRYVEGGYTRQLIVGGIGVTIAGAAIVAYAAPLAWGFGISLLGFGFAFGALPYTRTFRKQRQKYQVYYNGDLAHPVVICKAI